MGKAIILQFTEAINEHDLEKLGILMTDGHQFIDAHNNIVKGKEKMLNGWRRYYEWFPDYKIEVETILQDNNILTRTTFRPIILAGPFINLNFNKY